MDAPWQLVEDWMWCFFGAWNYTFVGYIWLPRSWSFHIFSWAPATVQDPVVTHCCCPSIHLEGPVGRVAEHPNRSESFLGVTSPVAPVLGYLSNIEASQSRQSGAPGVLLWLRLLRGWGTGVFWSEPISSKESFHQMNSWLDLLILRLVDWWIVDMTRMMNDVVDHQVQYDTTRLRSPFTR